MPSPFGSKVSFAIPGSQSDEALREPDKLVVTLVEYPGKLRLSKYHLPLEAVGAPLRKVSEMILPAAAGNDQVI